MLCVKGVSISCGCTAMGPLLNYWQLPVQAVHHAVLCSHKCVVKSTAWQAKRDVGVCSHISECWAALL